MVVPLRKHRHLRMEGTEIFVEPIVFVVAAKLPEGLGDGGFFLRDDVSPDLAAGQFQFRRHRAIGIDVIAGVNEEIGVVLQHGPVGPHAAQRRIDAKTLARGIARPDEGDRFPRARRSAEMSDLRLAGDAALVQRFKLHAVENIPSGRQAIEQQFCGEIGAGQCVGRCPAKHGLEILVGRAFHPHPRRPVRPRPDHCGVGRDVARLNSGGNQWSIRRAAEIGLCETTDARERGGRGCAHEQLTPCQATRRASGNRHRARISVESRRRVPAEFNSRPTVLRQRDDSARPRRIRAIHRQLQMPPERQGQVWMRMSRAWASSGLVWRLASFARAGTWRGSARTVGVGGSACAALTLVVRTTVGTLGRLGFLGFPWLCRRLGGLAAAVGLGLDGNRGELGGRAEPFWRQHGLGQIQAEILIRAIVVGECLAAQRQNPRANRCNERAFQDHGRLLK